MRCPWLLLRDRLQAQHLAGSGEGEGLRQGEGDVSDSREPFLAAWLCHARGGCVYGPGSLHLQHCGSCAATGTPRGEVTGGCNRLAWPARQGCKAYITLLHVLRPLRVPSKLGQPPLSQVRTLWALGDPQVMAVSTCLTGRLSPRGPSRMYSLHVWLTHYTHLHFPFQHRTRKPRAQHGPHASHHRLPRGERPQLSPCRHHALDGSCEVKWLRPGRSPAHAARQPA